MDDAEISEIVNALGDLGVKLDGIQNELSGIRSEMVTKNDAKTMASELKNTTFFTYKKN